MQYNFSSEKACRQGCFLSWESSTVAYVALKLLLQCDLYGRIGGDEYAYSTDWIRLATMALLILILANKLPVTTRARLIAQANFIVAVISRVTDKVQSSQYFYRSFLATKAIICTGKFTYLLTVLHFLLQALSTVHWSSASNLQSCKMKHLLE